MIWTLSAAGQRNWVVVKAGIDQQANATVGRGPKERNELSQAEIDLITERLDGIMSAVEGALFLQVAWWLARP